MPDMPDIRGRDRLKPLCYDPDKERFITLDDLIDRRAEIVPLERLDDQQKKLLVIERHRVGEGFVVQPISGVARVRSQVVREIEADTEFGRRAVAAEIMYLEELLEQIRAAL